MWNMKNRKSSYLIIALNKLLDGKTLSYIDGAKNSNQYFCIIKNQGIELIEVWKPNLTNQGKHLDRRLNLTSKNIERTEQYLYSLQGLKAKKITKNNHKQKPTKTADTK
jgi:hypothetical protein